MMQSASNIPLVHIFAVVCQSGAAEANKWIAESRNIAADYQRAYGKPAPRVKDCVFKSIPSTQGPQPRVISARSHSEVRCNK